MALNRISLSWALISKQNWFLVHTNIFHICTLVLFIYVYENHETWEVEFFIVGEILIHIYDTLLIMSISSW